MVLLRKFPYKYFDYEVELMRREMNLLFPDAIIEDSKCGIVGTGIQKEQISMLDQLTYIKSFEYEGQNKYTLQAKLESTSNDANKRNKQQTRYSTNGLHEYKGKFNPQLVHSIINILGIKKGMSVIDPFCGSGTTLLECQHMGILSKGTDINPLAVFIANAKISSLTMDITHACKVLGKIANYVSSPKELEFDDSSERIIYLKKWLPIDILATLEGVRIMLDKEHEVIANFFKVMLSNLIREYSFQEPSDLRIRKRFSSFPETSLADVFLVNAQKQLKQISLTQELIGRQDVLNCAVNGDIRTDISGIIENTFDAAITSPPYATALPYIDTQRLSLVWLGLCTPKDIMKLESSLIGSREMYNEVKKLWNTAIISNENKLPIEVVDMIGEMQTSISSSDGFRKQAMPTLLYRYFADMKTMFLNMTNVLRANAYFVLVVGHNKTTLGEKAFHIHTPDLLATIAMATGWEVDEKLPLQTYQRYGLNSKNSINSETLLILRNARARR